MALRECGGEGHGQSPWSGEDQGIGASEAREGLGRPNTTVQPSWHMIPCTSPCRELWILPREKAEEHRPAVSRCPAGAPHPRERRCSEIDWSGRSDDNIPVELLLEITSAMNRAEA